MISTLDISSGWPDVWVTVLAHSLWIGSFIAVAVAVLLRRISCERPDLRCGVAYSAMIVTVLGSLIAAAFLPTQRFLQHSGNQAPLTTVTKSDGMHWKLQAATELDEPFAEEEQSLLARATSTSTPTATNRSVSWQRLLVGAWLTGVAFMMLRLGRSHISAYRLVQRSADISSDEIVRLLDEIASVLQITKQVSLRISDDLLSPLIYGIVTPTILVPASFVTSAPIETLRIILGHELWHLRRGDLVWGHGQRLIESLLFYHPAIWWLSRQVDCEREAACDRAAVRITGQPREVAKVLLDAAEHCLPQQAVGLAFADKQLPERVQRLIKPNGQSRLRVWWGGLFGLGIVGFVAIAGLTAGTGLISQEVAAALTPSERLKAIEIAVAEAEEGIAPRIDPTTGQIANDVPRHKVTGQFVAEDDKAFPRWSRVEVTGRGISKSITLGREARFETQLPLGVTFFVAPEIKGFAPTRFGPYKVADSPLDLGELRLERGFESQIRVTDNKGNPLEGVRVDSALIWTHKKSRGMGKNLPELEQLVSDVNGVLDLRGLIDWPIDITLEKAGYQRFRREQSFDPDSTVAWQLEPSQPLAMSFLDTDSQPIAGVEVYCLRSEGDSLRSGTDPRDDFLRRLDGRSASGWQPVAVSDSQGQIELTSLVDDTTYWFMTLHSKHAPSLVNSVQAGDQPRTITLSPPLEIRGRIVGDTSRLLGQRENCNFFCTHSITIAGTSRSSSRSIKMDEEGWFTVRQLLPGQIYMTIGEHQIQRTLTNTIDNLVIDLDELKKQKERDYRTVRLRLAVPGGQPVRGVAQVIWSLPASREAGRQQKNLMLTVPDEEPVIEFRAPIGAKLTLAGRQLIGAITDGPFNQQILGTVPPSEGVYEHTVTLRPAGLVTGKVIDASGTPLPASRVSVRRVKHHFSDADDELSDTARFAIGNLPLDEEAIYVAEARINGTWQFTASKPFKITETKPIHDTTLVVPQPVFLTGRVLQHDGSPASNRRISMRRSVQTHSHSAGDVSSLDDEGRFRLAINPKDDADKYTIQVEHGSDSTGITLEYVPNSWGSGRDFGTVKVGQAGIIHGYVVTADGSPVTNTKVEASHLDWKLATYRRNHYTETDNGGHFLITGVELVPYKLQIDFGKRRILQVMPELTQESDMSGSPTLVFDPSKETRELRIVVGDERK